MKKLYTFPIDIDKKKVEVFVAKPSQSEIEDAEFIYAQKFNQLLQDGFLSKAMMNKKFGDIGGIFSDKNNKELSAAVLELLDAKKKIEFYGGSKTLSPSQQEELERANATYAMLQKKIVEGDLALESMFSKSADAKAEEHMVKWFILNMSYYVAEIEDGDSKKSQEFKLFEKPTFHEQIEQLSSLFEEPEEFDSENLKLKKEIISKAFVLIGRVLSVWYNGYGTDQESIQKSLNEFFPNEHSQKEVAPKKKVSKKVKEG